MHALSDGELTRRAAELEWLLCDVDGVLTDGGLYYDRRGHAMLRFDVRDGLGFHLARRAGLKLGLLSGRASAALDHRAAELGIDVVLSGASDKAAALDELLEQQSTAARRIAFIGDDLQDLTVLGRCGLSFAPADAVAEVRAVAHRVLSSPGGRGVVREAVEVLLKARGDWDGLFASFTFDR